MAVTSDSHTQRYVLDFVIPPELYKRAITQPIPGRERPDGMWMTLRTGFAIAAMSGAILCFCLAFFDLSALAPMGFGFVLGAVIILGIWWKQHRGLVGVHMDVNAKAEQHHYEIDASGIIAARDHIRSEIGWPFVTAIRSVEGATLIEVQTARLIVPDAALNVSAEAFRADLETWRTA